MRILHITPRFIGGGPERHLLALAGAWKAAGWTAEHRVAVLDPPISAALLLKARKLGIRFMAAPSMAQLEEAILNTDVVEIITWNHPRLLDALRYEWPPSRVVLNCVIAGVSAPQVLFEDLGRIADVFLITARRSVQTAALRFADRTGAPIAYIPALADMSRLDGFSARPHHGIRVGYLGLIEPAKMHPRFAELCAAVRSREVTFEVFGDGSWTPALERRFEELGAGNRVNFHGHVDDLKEAFANLDVFGYPLALDAYSTSEKAVQEAMWAGIPPVVLAGTGASELIDHEHTGLVCESENDYPHAIDRLAADAQLRRRLGGAARLCAREHFDPARNAARIHKLFESALALPRRRRQPLSHRGAPAAERFVQSLGELAQDFAASLGGPLRHTLEELRKAETAIASSSPVLAFGEGGVIHYRNSFPEDAYLRLWSGLIAQHNGDGETAVAEFQAAMHLGLPASRIPMAAAKRSRAAGEALQ